MDSVSHSALNAAAPAAQERAAMSIDQFAGWSGICKTLVYEAIKSKRLKARRITKRRIIILPQDATDFMNSLPVVELAEAA